MDIETLEEIQPADVPKKTKIFLNGKWLGLYDDP
jgi:hypothetical protein